MASQNEPWEAEGRRWVCRPRGLPGGGVRGLCVRVCQLGLASLRGLSQLMEGAGP